MDVAQPLIFKIATEPWEFEAIHRLNYRTFVEEIPQHEPQPDGRLVDRFHDENTYAICLDGDQLVGMVCGRANRPFSLDGKLENLDSYLPPGRHIIEARLLAVEKPYRNGVVFARLCGTLVRHMGEDGYDLAVITGTTRQQKLYRHLGFIPFGPELGTPEARFQPMYLTLESFMALEPILLGRLPDIEAELANFLPGPVDIRADVRAAFSRPPVSHRSGRFEADFHATQRALCALTGAAHVQMLPGSGSLANDAVAGQLALLDAPGLVISQGEFGERLMDHATGHRLDFRDHRMAWGATLEPAEVRRLLADDPSVRWLWIVHCETSTGVLNDLPAIRAACAEFGVRLCVDAISSLGTVAVDLADVYLASGVSGKGLGSYAGLSLVFHDHPLTAAPDRLAPYLDVGLYAERGGIPFTVSSNLVHALYAAVSRTDWPERYAEIARVGGWLRQGFATAGLEVLVPVDVASPAVLTIPLPNGVSSKAVGRQLERSGFLLSYNSRYLLARNWIQVCLMGEWAPESVERLPEVVGSLVSGTPSGTPHPVAATA